MARDLNGLSEESTEQVIRFPPKQQSSISADEAGQAVIAKIRKAAELSHETCDRAMALAHKLAMQIREAEDRINRLERDVAFFRDRAARAEGWLQTIYKEIEEKLIAPRSAVGTEQNLLSSSNPNNSQTTRPSAANWGQKDMQMPAAAPLPLIDADFQRIEESVPTESSESAVAPKH